MANSKRSKSENQHPADPPHSTSNDSHPAHVYNDDTSDPVIHQHRLINAAQIRRLLPISTMSIWRYEQAGKLPRHFSISGRNFWRLSEVLDAIKRLQQPATENEEAE